MHAKWIGALLIIFSCGYLGFFMAAQKRKSERMLLVLSRGISFMKCELKFHLTPLPDLCILAAQHTKGDIGYIFQQFAKELTNYKVTDVTECMDNVLFSSASIPQPVRKIFIELGEILGCFDLEGQLKGLDAVSESCDREIEALSTNRDVRLRSYQTLGLCAGAALVILLI